MEQRRSVKLFWCSVVLTWIGIFGILSSGGKAPFPAAWTVMGIVFQAIVIRLLWRMWRKGGGSVIPKFEHDLTRQIGRIELYENGVCVASRVVHNVREVEMVMRVFEFDEAFIEDRVAAYRQHGLPE